ncbi:MAG TPA: ArdC-like ssDNA-binding domain-containing protein, partial [Ignavibacteriaceae bacterium]|nr:ArdC-like ssDNA-binding domain-containing protein [Ignavibacteriaceae bacterium]
MKEEKKERIKQLVKKLSEFSDEQRETIAQKFGIRNPEGHMLTGRNQSLLYLQAEGKPLSVVGGFQQWQKYNRVVKKGERGYLIAVPSAVKKSN